MKIFLIRHGQSEYNINFKPGLIRPFTDPLTELGKKEANEIGEYLINKNINNKYIYSSPYTRTLQTAQIINNYLKTELITEDGLKEYNVGDWDGKPEQEILNNIAKFPKSERYKFVPPNGESWLAVAERFRRVINDTMTDNAIYISHLAPIRLVINLLTELDPAEWTNTEFLSPGSITELEHTDNKWQIKNIINKDN